jgi:hypothetical protein
MAAIPAVDDRPPTLAALAAVLPSDAKHPVEICHIPEGIVAAYNPLVETRASVWALLTALFGPLRDVTPAGAA